MTVLKGNSVCLIPPLQNKPDPFSLNFYAVLLNLLCISINKPAPIIVHRMSFQSKTPLPGVKIVINSLAINPDMEIPTDQ